ncbi:hemerythrin domain-containing protein [Acidithiobacillus sp. IBUN Pt1247-S3]|uniref:hemerythrin domain-containing protein n=1 Tax=Acidithiobacillus sp. IBUN Pt1247-S3 TaxID=3166642 RepID=UPI0034E57F3F
MAESAELSTLSLDLRGVPDAKAGPLLFTAAQRLGLGQKITLQIDRDPHTLLRATAFQLRDAISWTVNGAGHDWQAEVLPRKEAEAKDVVDLLTWDHYRLDRQFADVLAAANGNRIQEAESIFQDYWIGLRRHVHMENYILGPVLGGGEKKGPLADMLFEHDSIIHQSRLVDETFQEQDYGMLPAICAMLSGSLAKHENREENTLFPIWQAANNQDKLRAEEFLLETKALLAGADDATVKERFPD